MNIEQVAKLLVRLKATSEQWAIMPDLVNELSTESVPVAPNGDYDELVGRVNELEEGQRKSVNRGSKARKELEQRFSNIEGRLEAVETKSQSNLTSQLTHGDLLVHLDKIIHDIHRILEGDERTIAKIAESRISEWTGKLPEDFDDLFKPQQSDPPANDLPTKPPSEPDRLSATEAIVEVLKEAFVTDGNLWKRADLARLAREKAPYLSDKSFDQPLKTRIVKLGRTPQFDRVKLTDEIGAPVALKRKKKGFIPTGYELKTN